jgi:hypothetical protein
MSLLKNICANRRSDLAMTQCTQPTLEFHHLGRREVIAKFDAPAITSDAGGLLLREVDARFQFIKQFANCFDDHRSPRFTVHSLHELLSQRIFGIALGYEDLNDHDELRHDPLMAVLAGKTDPTPQDGFALAGKSTLNRLELTPVGANEDSRYKKIVARHGDIEKFFVDAFLQVHSQTPERIVLDLDATDDPLHGHQLGRFFHGYYKSYCYLPLYIFCGSHLLCAKLRPSNIDASAGSVRQLDRIVQQIRAQWPQVQIVIRGDSGFCRDNLMSWCESNQVQYVLGLQKNTRLKRILGKEQHEAKLLFQETGEASRVFKDFRYRTRKSWNCERRVIGKAEHLAKGENPRFIVTNLPQDEYDAATVYEDEYCARGDMENRIKEQQLYLFADRTSASTMRANQLRLWLSSVAYVQMNALREVGLRATPLAKAQCHTIRLKLFKIGAAIRVTVRKVWLSFSAAYPYAETFIRVLENLRALPLARPSPG